MYKAFYTYFRNIRKKLEPDRKVTNAEETSTTDKHDSVYENEVLKNEIKEENATKTPDSEL